MKPYRVASFTVHYPPEADAEGYVTAKWVNALRQIDYDIEIFQHQPSLNRQHTFQRLRARMWALSQNLPQILQYDLFDLTQIDVIAPYVARSVESFLKRHQDTPFDFIVSRYEPVGSAIAAYWAHQLSGVPWVASYNDPIPRLTVQRPGLIGHWDRHRNGFQKKWLSRLLSTPSWYVFPTERMRRWIIEEALRFGVDAKNLYQRSHIIPHVGGPIDASTTLSEKSGQFDQQDYTIRHLGYLSSVRDPGTLVAALELWEGCPDLPPIRVEFIGNTTAQRESFNRFLETPKTRVCLRLLPEVSPDEAFHLMKTANACLLIEQPATESIFLPSKFCDYAVAGKTVLAITCEDAVVTDYLKQYGGGEVAVHGKPDDVFAVLRNFVQDGQTGSAALASQFTPHSIASAWEDVFQNCRIPSALI